VDHDAGCQVRVGAPGRVHGERSRSTLRAQPVADEPTAATAQPAVARTPRSRDTALEADEAGTDPDALNLLEERRTFGCEATLDPHFSILLRTVVHRLRWTFRRSAASRL
jgi:hypothetical protein